MAELLAPYILRTVGKTVLSVLQLSGSSQGCTENKEHQGTFVQDGGGSHNTSTFKFALKQTQLNYSLALQDKELLEETFRATTQHKTGGDHDCRQYFTCLQVSPTVLWMHGQLLFLALLRCLLCFGVDTECLVLQIYCHFVLDAT